VRLKSGDVISLRVKMVYMVEEGPRAAPRRHDTQVYPNRATAKKAIRVERRHLLLGLRALTTIVLLAFWLPSSLSVARYRASASAVETGQRHRGRLVVIRSPDGQVGQYPLLPLTSLGALRQHHRADRHVLQSGARAGHVARGHGGWKIATAATARCSTASRSPSRSWYIGDVITVGRVELKSSWNKRRRNVHLSEKSPSVSVYR